VPAGPGRPAPASPSQPGADEAKRPRPPVPAGRAGGRLSLMALATAGTVVAVQQTLVIPLLPTLMGVFDTSVTAVTWVFTASLLAGAVATPLLTRFGDMYGKKRMIMLAMGALIAGSALCALSGSLGALIAGRALQGVSVSLIPLAIGTIRDAFPPDRLTTSFGVVSATMGIGGAAGMIVTGLIAARTTSHAPVFWVAAGMAAAAMVFVGLCAPEAGERAGGRPDVPGAAVMAAWLVCLLLGISQGNAWGWTSPRILGLFGAAAAICAAWVWLELRVREPLVRLALLAGRRSLSANLASLLLGFALFSMFTLLAGFIQAPRERVGYGLSGSVLDVGLLMLPSTVTTLLCSVLAGRISARIGPAFTLALGSGFVAVSYAWFAMAHGRVSDLLVFGAIQGVGFGTAYAALGTLAVQHVPMDQSGIASGINSLVRTTGGSVAGAVTSAVLGAFTIAGTDIPSQGAYVLCFWIGTAGAVLAALVALTNGLRYRHV
jgi:MFS family permease